MKHIKIWEKSHFCYYVILLTTLLLLPCLSHSETPPPSHYLLAQADDNTEAYDPFADYTEFDEATEEEADVNFFKNGRFFSIGIIGGYRMFTQILGELYTPGAYFGGFINYFFDLRFAMQVSYVTGDHPFALSIGSQTFKGTANLQYTSFDIKYYLNTQNVTRGLASINPYCLVGLSQVYRTQRVDGQDGFSRDSAMGFQGGFGMEFPLMQNKMFIGAEATYHYIGFPDENNEFKVQGLSSGVYPRGDTVRFQGILGVNF